MTRLLILHFPYKAAQLHDEVKRHVQTFVAHLQMLALRAVHSDRFKNARDVGDQTPPSSFCSHTLPVQAFRGTPTYVGKKHFCVLDEAAALPKRG